MSVVIQVDRLSKQYRLGTIGGKRLVDDVNRWWAKLRGKEDPLSKVGSSQLKGESRKQKPEKDSTSRLSFNFPLSALTPPPSETLWALKDVSFEVKQGEVLGIIGRNGAGKSTLLKILSRVTAPTSGEVRVKGRIASLLEVGTGFHPELTGRENIFLNGAILGMTKTEIRNKFDEIVAFAEIQQFIDTPVKRYSSGMYVRLAFAVAAHLEPEILIVDEVLAVGDIEFQKKCLGKMKDVAGQGRTVLFVSHNMAAVAGLCTKGILLNVGRIAQVGEASNVVDGYVRSTNGGVSASSDLRCVPRRCGTGRVTLTSFHVESPDGTICSTVLSGSEVVIVLGYECREQLTSSGVDVGFSIATENGILLSVFYASYVGQLLRNLPAFGQLRCKIETFPFAAGLYNVGARVTVGGVEADWPRDGVGQISVEAGDFYGTGHRGFAGRSTFLLRGVWSCSQTSCAQPR